jgi:hypothetical protein
MQVSEWMGHSAATLLTHTHTSLPTCRAGRTHPTRTRSKAARGAAKLAMRSSQIVPVLSAVSTAGMRGLRGGGKAKPKQRDLGEVVRELAPEALREIVASAADRHGDVERHVRLAAAREAGDLAELRAEVDRELRTRRFLGYREGSQWARAAGPVVEELRTVAASPTSMVRGEPRTSPPAGSQGWRSVCALPKRARRSGRSRRCPGTCSSRTS